MNPITNLTPEQRAEYAAKGRANRIAQQEAWKAEAHLLRQDFADEPYWRKLASKHGVRMPFHYVPGSELKVIRKAIRTLELSRDDIKDSIGTIESFQKLNPTYPAFALIGFLLEIAEEKTL